MSNPPLNRGIFCNRTLNFRSIKAIGYDLDYTLVHYNTYEWERRAYHHTKLRLADRGWPVADLVFDPDQVIQGLTIDLELGNLLKVTRFGYVIRATHGTRLLEFDEVRRAYAETVVDLHENRWVFINTLFSLSEASLFAQLVDLADEGKIPEVVGYENLYRIVRRALDGAHMEGTLKGEILADPDRFIEADPQVVPMLIDQREAGKQLMLITNSEWEYAEKILTHVFDPQLPEGQTWQDLFDTVMVSAGKPDFFERDQPLYRVVDMDRALLKPAFGPMEPGGVYFGGSAHRVETSLGLSGDEILYVGDHLFGDVHVSKSALRWRTALVIHELEAEIDALAGFAEQEAKLIELMGAKEKLEAEQAELRLIRQRNRYAPVEPARSNRSLDRDIENVRTRLTGLDEVIAPLAIAAGVLSNDRWGMLMRAGADKSLFARQVERYADVYTSRVSNLLYATPNGFLRAFRSPLPHDQM
ncbi:MAG: HAD-IG family 5'-nucleotidase [Acidimicrobiia bacterium]